MEHARKLNDKEDITNQLSVGEELSVFEHKEQAIKSYLKEENISEATQEDWDEFWYNSQSEGKDIDQDNHSTVT